MSLAFLLSQRYFTSDSLFTSWLKQASSWGIVFISESLGQLTFLGDYKLHLLIHKVIPTVNQVLLAYHLKIHRQVKRV